ncbi:hypothetical protein GC105_15945 [Alkalibaculum sp. M08DMB]|uniref:Sporulation lipoprotein YhcN/YlaJ (Spore_YhcN_YlaJ) n=1 Tax=Alkalibaculum sporogenes TaxID=2655001 RepID=A0A6A7KCK4_9FIRM|nr:YhcN/YlaJ family sporulation lipoprotein [Alkalibaculum sporogenes]MPW27259.1 hypothetical protein [Alkalibaculum sporogenes]
MKRIITAITVFTLVATFSFGCRPATPVEDGQRGTTRNNIITNDGTANDTTRNQGATGIANGGGSTYYGTADGVGGAGGTGNMGGTNAIGGTGGAGEAGAGGAGTGGTNAGGTRTPAGTLNNNAGRITDGNWNTALGETNRVNEIRSICNRKENVDDTSVVINDNNNTCYVGLDLDNNANLTETMKEQLSNEIKRADPNINRVYFTEDRNAVEDFVGTARDTVNVNWNRLQNLFR